MSKPFRSSAAALVCWLGLIPLSGAYAYTDPGTGALLWQILAGAAVGGMFYVRRFFAWLSRKK